MNESEKILLMQKRRESGEHMQSYSFDCVVSQLLGLIKVNDNEVFRCWLNRSSSETTTYYRGINTIILDAMSCTTRDWRGFDTYWSIELVGEVRSNTGTAQDFIDYFTGLPSGTVLLAISCDDAFYKLGNALPMLKTAGVDVSDVGFRGMFAFILQKGYPGKTVLVKKQTSAQCSALSLDVSTTGWFQFFTQRIIIQEFLSISCIGRGPFRDREDGMEHDKQIDKYMFDRKSLTSVYNVISSYLLGDPRIPNPPPPQKNTQNTKNFKKCIEFTPRYVSPQNLESRINTEVYIR